MQCCNEFCNKYFSLNGRVVSKRRQTVLKRRWPSSEQWISKSPGLHKQNFAEERIDLTHSCKARRPFKSLLMAMHSCLQRCKLCFSWPRKRRRDANHFVIHVLQCFQHFLPCAECAKNVCNFRASQCCRLQRTPGAFGGWCIDVQALL